MGQMWATDQSLFLRLPILSNSLRLTLIVIDFLSFPDQRLFINLQTKMKKDKKSLINASDILFFPTSYDYCEGELY